MQVSPRRNVPEPSGVGRNIFSKSRSWNETSPLQHVRAEGVSTRQFLRITVKMHDSICLLSLLWLQMT